MSANRPLVLILCTGNAGRSQMAEGLLRAKAGEAFDVQSAGTEPAARVNPFAVEAMREIGIDISAARTKNVSEFHGRLPVHHVITVCDHAAGRCPTVWPGVVTRVHWPIEDPAASLDAFRQARDEISARLDDWLPGILHRTR
jgi:arsenate reductase